MSQFLGFFGILIFQVLSIATPVKVKEFKWTDCGGADSLAHIKSLSINNPVYEPGPLTISTVVDVTTALDKLKVILFCLLW